MTVSIRKMCSAGHSACAINEPIISGVKPGNVALEVSKFSRFSAVEISILWRVRHNHAKNANIEIFSAAAITGCCHVHLVMTITDKPLIIKEFHVLFHVRSYLNWASKSSRQFPSRVEDNQEGGSIFSYCLPGWLARFFLELIVFCLTARPSCRKSYI